MANINALFPTKYIKAADLNNQDVTLQIAGLTVEEIDEGDQKPVVRFVGHPQGLVLNKTNALVIAEMYGEDYDRWAGRPVTLYATKCDMAGKRVDCIRIRPGTPQLPQQGWGNMPPGMPQPPQGMHPPQQAWGQQPPPLPPAAYSQPPQQNWGNMPPGMSQPPQGMGGYHQ